LHEFRSTLQSRAEVSSVRSELAMSTDPLREDQVEPMIAVVDAELQRMNQEIRNLAASAEQISDVKRSELAIAANQRIVEAAVPILTSVQLAALKDLYRRQRVQMEAQAELNRLQSEEEIVDSKAVALN
jgi:molybdopterin biosynthesis enzyme